MSRRTISFPSELEERVAQLADRQGQSFSAAVVGLVAYATREDSLPYEGAARGPGDLSTAAEDYLGTAADRLRT